MSLRSRLLTRRVRPMTGPAGRVSRAGRTRVVVAAAALVAGALVPPGSRTAEAAGAATSCDGRPVTISGQPGAVATGTPGDDVIASNGAREVDAGAGADRVCVTGPARDHVEVVAGDGADRVLVLLDDPGTRISAQLGDGADVLESGATADYVQAAGGSVADGDADRIETGAGGDFVESGGRGADVGDVVLLGDGDDWLEVGGRPGAGHRFVGGPGVDLLRPGVTPGPGRLVVDNVVEQATLDGVVVQRWHGFEVFRLVTDQAQSVVFRGGPAAEDVSVSAFGSGPLVRASMGAGDDVLAITEQGYLPADAAPQESPYDGGPGRDRLVAGVVQDDLDLDDRLVGDLQRGTLVAVDGGTKDTVRLRRFEDLRLYGAAVALRGDRAANTLQGYGCTVSMSGRGGADVLAQPRRFENNNGCRRGMRMWGGPGADLLVGRQGPDRLLGGPGRDRAVGRGGRDLCRAEVRVGCERTR